MPSSLALMMVLQVLQVGILRHFGISLLLGGLDGDQVCGLLLLLLLGIDDGQALGLLLKVLQVGILRHFGIPLLLRGLKGDQVGDLLLLLFPGIDDGQALGLLLQEVSSGTLVSSSCLEVLRAIRFAPLCCFSSLALMMVRLWASSCSCSCSGVLGAIRFVNFCCSSSLALKMVRLRASFCWSCRSVSPHCLLVRDWGSVEG